MSGAVTILDVALSRGAKADASGAITMGEFDRVGLPMLGGCQSCGASIAPYNACPSRTGYLRCRDCVDDLGFETPAAFEAWCDAEDANA